MYEAELDKLETQKENLQKMIDQIESGLMDAHILEIITLGTSTMNNILENKSTEEIKKSLEEIQEVIDDQKEINNIISQDIDPVTYDIDIEKELEIEKNTKPKSTPEKVSKEVKEFQKPKEESIEEEYKELEKAILT